MSNGKTEALSITAFKKWPLANNFRIETKDGTVLSSLCRYCFEVKYNDFMWEARSRSIKGSALKSFFFFFFFEKKLHSSKYICPSCRNFNFFSPLVWKKSEATTVLVMNNLNWALLSLVKNKWMKILLTIIKNNRVLFLTVLTLFYHKKSS